MCARQGAFDSFEHGNLPRTKYDQHVDETSNKPGEQAFEVLPRRPRPTHGAYTHPRARN
jgi:hypothetical protein